MATLQAPAGSTPPKCACGCGAVVSWRPGKGWSTYVRGHQSRGKPGTRRGHTNSPTHREKIARAQTRRWAGKRRRDIEPVPGQGVYSTKEYRDARERLVAGKPCSRCGTLEDVCAHHMRPGDDTSLVPLCRKCHPVVHGAPGHAGKEPWPGSQPPVCKCGCGRPTRWKRSRGWAQYCKGHGNAKVPAGTRLQEPHLCECGCGETTTFRHGKGWNQYKRGHGQRVLGTSYRVRAQAAAR